MQVKDYVIGLGVVLLLCVDGWGCAAPENETCREHRCNAVAMAFEATDPLVEHVVADLRESTGADVITDPYGVPVLWVPEVTSRETGERLCGVTRYARRKSSGDILWQEIWIATESREGCGPMSRTLAHELIHALAPDAAHIEGPAAFADPASSDHFTRADAAVICAAVACDR